MFQYDLILTSQNTVLVADSLTNRHQLILISKLILFLFLQVFEVLVFFL